MHCHWRANGASAHSPNMSDWGTPSPRARLSRSTTLPRPLSARFTLSSMTRRAIVPALVLVALMSGAQASASAATDPSGDAIRLELSPRICTLAIDDKQCETWVHARWRSPHEESLCLVIV